MTLSSITIPKNVTSIGGWAFKNCTELKEIHCLAEAVPEVEDDTFGGMNVSEVLLVVPDVAVDSYKAHPVWGQFKITTTTDVRVATTEGRNTKDVYDLGGRKQPTPLKGLNIVRMGDGTVKKVWVK